MNKLLASIFLCSFFAVLTASEKQVPVTKEKNEFKTQKEKLSYCMGQIIGEKIKSGDIEMNVDILVASLRDHIEGKESKLSKVEMNKVMIAHNKDSVKRRDERTKLIAQKGVEYLELNGKKENVIQYKVIKEGTGAKPLLQDKVKVHYTGRTVLGKIFDSSRGKGDPVEFPLNRVIRGWTESLMLMPVGSRWEIAIPSHLAYGENPDPRSGILPNEILIFDVELIEIIGKKSINK